MKTRGARDRVGLRRIVSEYYGRWLVEHYRWKKTPDGKYQAVRKPYSSDVGKDKVCLVYTMTDDLILIKQERVNYGR